MGWESDTLHLVPDPENMQHSTIHTVRFDLTDVYQDIGIPDAVRYCLSARYHQEPVKAIDLGVGIRSPI